MSFCPRVSVSSSSANASGEDCAAGVRGDLLGLLFWSHQQEGFEGVHKPTFSLECELDWLDLTGC